jgi:hypothetical protein
MAVPGVVHRDDEPVGTGQLVEQCIRQVRGERRDAALARQVIPERRESPNLTPLAHPCCPVGGAERWRRERAFEFRNALQRRAPQSLRITRDLALALALEVGCPAIECHDQIEEILQDGVV